MQDEVDAVVALLEQVKQLTVESCNGKKQVNDELDRTKREHNEQQTQIGTLNDELKTARAHAQAALSRSTEQQTQIGTMNEELKTARAQVQAALSRSTEQQTQIGTMNDELKTAREQNEKLTRMQADERQAWNEPEEVMEMELDLTLELEQAKKGAEKQAENETEEQAKKGAEKQAKNETEEQAKKDAPERLHKGNSNFWASVH
jgi:hypothetical protein